MAQFLTGCTHFGHANIIKLAGRPFDTVEEMDAEMIQRWNETVTMADTVYHLGDFCWPTYEPLRLMAQLNFRLLVWVRGNHDGFLRDRLPGDRMKTVDGRPVETVDYLEPRGVVLFHYPIEEWNGWFKGLPHFHAHTHVKEKVTAPRRVSVGVEAWDYRPVRWEDAAAAADNSAVDMGETT